jgi:hypothetical protein
MLLLNRMVFVVMTLARDFSLVQWGSLVSIVSDYRLDRATGFDSRQRQRIFPLTSVSKPVLRPTQPPVRWVPGVLSPGLKGSQGVTLTTHPHLVPRSWLSRSYTSSLPSRLHDGTGTASFTIKCCEDVHKCCLHNICFHLLDSGKWIFKILKKCRTATIFSLKVLCRKIKFLNSGITEALIQPRRLCYWKAPGLG